MKVEAIDRSSGSVLLRCVEKKLGDKGHVQFVSRVFKPEQTAQAEYCGPEALRMFDSGSSDIHASLQRLRNQAVNQGDMRSRMHTLVETERIDTMRESDISELRPNAGAETAPTRSSRPIPCKAGSHRTHTVAQEKARAAAGIPLSSGTVPALRNGGIGDATPKNSTKAVTPMKSKTLNAKPTRNLEPSDEELENQAWVERSKAWMRSEARNHKVQTESVREAQMQLEDFHEKRKLWTTPEREARQAELNPVSYTHLTMPTTPYV